MPSPAPTEAITALQTLVNEIDPVYRPARFLLGYAYLSSGEAALAVEVFEGLLKEFEEAARNSAYKVRSKWLERLPRMIWLSKRLPGLAGWRKRWMRETRSVMGGSVYQAAISWKRLKELKTDQSDIGLQLRQQNIDSALRPLPKNLVFREWIEIAIGRRPSDDPKPEKAGRLLDAYLDLRDIERFDWALYFLRTDCILLERAESPLLADKLPKAEYLVRARERFAELRKMPLGEILKTSVERLEKTLADKRWDDCDKLIEELRGLSAVPHPLNLMTLLNDASVDSWGARVAGLFFPAFALVRRERKNLRQPLYAETVYHLALALFLTHEPESIKRALDMIEAIQRTKVLPRWFVTRSVSNVEVLMVSLEAQAASLHAAKTREAGGWLRLDEIKAEWKSVFAKLAKSRKRSPEIRAAALTASGIIAGDERRDRQRYEDAQPYSERSGEPEVLLNAEMDFYRRALDLHATSVTHCYLAECLFAADLKDQARAHVTRALQISPALLMALELQQRLSGDRKAT